MKTIGEVEAQVEGKVSEALRELGIVPTGYACRARMRGASRKKRQSASFEKHWSADRDSIQITFERRTELARASSQPVAPSPTTTDASSQGGPVSDLVKALDRAESQPGFSFVALKRFRDVTLPSEGFAWTSVGSERQKVLSEAIVKRLILTSRVPNPRSPQFPVTAIRLNRLMPEVRAILGARDEVLTDFQPVAIRGQGLSATVLRERR